MGYACVMTKLCAGKSEAGVEAGRQARFQDYIARVVDAAPPLSAEQRDRLAILLRTAQDGPVRIPATGASALDEMLRGK